MIEFATEGSVPTAKWPPEPWKNFAATALQTLIIKRFIDRGYGEGTQRLHKRLRGTFGQMIHPGIRLDKRPDDPTNVRKTPDGKPLLRETEEYDEQLRFQLHGVTFQLPRQATYEVALDPRTHQPIPFQRHEPRFFPTQAFKMRHTGWRPRMLCPTLLQVQNYFQLDPDLQIDRQTRNAVAGGIRQPLRNSIMPHLPPSVLRTVYIDTMRLPATLHVSSASSSLLEGGVVETRSAVAAATPAAAPRGHVAYRWLFVCVDGFSKYCYIAPIHQKGGLQASVAAPRKSDESVDPARPEERPQSEQTFEEFRRFLEKANELRRDHGLSEIHPSVVVRDNGSEFRGAFTGGMRALREQHVDKYKEKTTPNSRSQFNSPAERQVKTIRTYFVALRNAFEKSVAEGGEGGVIGTTATTQQQTRLKERGFPYDWVLDVPEVLRRYNTAHHTTIRCKPLEALLEIVPPTTIKERIHAVAKKRFEGVRHEMRLPGFSPSSPPEVGDFVRLKRYKSGTMNANFPRLDGLKTDTKTTSHNWSSDIFRVVAVKVVNYGLADAKAKQERLQTHVNESEDGGALLLDRAQRALLNNPVQGARLYHIENINPPKRHSPREGQKRKYFNRVEILKIPKETVVEGMPLDQLQEKYEREDDATKAANAAAAALRALRARQRQEEKEGEETTATEHGIPLDQRSSGEDLGDFSHSLPQLRQRGPARRFVYRNAAVLELNREFVIGFINEVKATPAAYNQSADLQALDELADVLDDDAGVLDAGLEGDELENAWSVYATVVRVERRGQYVLEIRFPSVATTRSVLVHLEIVVSQFSDGDGIDDNRNVRAVKNSDGTITDDYTTLRRGPGSYLLDNVPSSFSYAQVRDLNRRRT